MNVAAVTGLVSDVEVARRVLGAEAAGLRSLAASLDDTFGRAVELDLASARVQAGFAGLVAFGILGRERAGAILSPVGLLA